jgi:hypothetical protein
MFINYAWGVIFCMQCRCHCMHCACGVNDAMCIKHAVSMTPHAFKNFFCIGKLFRLWFSFFLCCSTCLLFMRRQWHPMHHASSVHDPACSVIDTACIKKISNYSWKSRNTVLFKGALTPEFWPLVFFINQLPLGPQSLPSEEKADGGNFRQLNLATKHDFFYPLLNNIDFAANSEGCTVFSKI